MADSSLTVGDVVDDIPLGRFHHRMLLVTGTVWGATALEILSISFTIPIFEQIWGLSGLQAGLLGGAGLLGMIFGNAAGGWYSDRAGRKRALMAAVAVFSVCTGLTALAVGFYSTFVLRLLTGLGVGATVAIDASYLTEHLPTARRGRYLAYLELFFAAGNLVTVLLAAVVLPSGTAGGTVAGLPAWRVYYAVGALPLALVVVLYAFAPESPYYLARSGQSERASERLRAIARANDVELDLPADRLSAETPTHTGFTRLFQPDLLRVTVLTSVLWFGLNFGYYGVFIWLPDTVQAAGYLGGMYAFLFVVSVFELLGVLAAAVAVDRVGRKRTLTTSFTMAGVATALFTAAIPGVDVGLGVAGKGFFLVGLFATGFFIFAIFGTIFAYTTELFPTEVRSTGLGFAGGVGKIAAVVGPVLVGSLVQYGYLAAMAPFALALAVAGVLVGLLGEETMGQTLR